MKRKPKRTTELDRAIGLRLRSLRMRRNLSQGDLAAKLGVSFQQVQKYEKGTNRLSGSRLVAVCEVLHVKPEVILGNGTGVFSDSPDLLEPLRDNQTARAFMAMSKLPRQQRIVVMHCIVMLVNAFTNGNSATTGEHND